MSDDPNQPKPTARAALTEHDALPAGTRFGEFEIIRVLGVGGFGIVYLAQDHSLERQVALKEYMPAALAARGAGAMITIRSGAFAETYAIGLRSFINEARLLARFDHPSLVKVYRFWEDNGTAYMVMPYLQGRTLRDARRAMAAPPDEAWIRSLLAPMIDALDLLHGEGVFHRDIAPDNILLPPAGAPILLDFGAARRVISDRTQSLTAILKPSYAPIEQYAEMAALRQGPWTDIYALGAVLHYLLFGVPPSPATARAVQPDAEPIEQRVVPGVSPRFMHLVAWMLGVRPLERPQNVAALRAALDGELPIPASLRHDVTVPGETARVPFAAPVAEAPYQPTLQVERSAYSAATQFDTAHQPTAVMTTPTAVRTTPIAPPAAAVPAPAPSASPVAPARAVQRGAAPLRSTPPGTPPPSYVPPPRPPRAAPAAADAPDAPVAARPPRRGLMAAGGFAALVLAAIVLWQFVGVIRAPRPVAGPLAAASTAARAAPAVIPGAYTGPTVAQVATVPQRGSGTAVPAAVAPLPVGVVEPAGAAASANRAGPKPAAARASELVLDASAPLVPEAPRLRPAAGTRVAPDPSLGPGNPTLANAPTSARAACGGRQFLALAVCLDRECERPRFRATPECVRVLDVKRLRAERSAGGP